MSFKGVFFWCMCLVLFQLSVAARVRHYKFEVEYIIKKPDCLEHYVMGINGQFPGPTIRAEVGGNVSIAVTNKLFTEGTVIHWHGILQRGTPWADGTAAISQCPINTGETYHYRFTVDKTLLINGRGQFNCSLAAYIENNVLPQCQFKDGEECAPEILQVDPKKTYRIRIASTTSLASLNLAISGSYLATKPAYLTLNIIVNHKLIVVEADGNYVHPFAVDDIDIYSGETYSVLLTTDQDPTKNYWLSVGVRGRKANTPQGLALLNYKTVHASVFPTSPPPITPLWDDFERSNAFTKKIISKMGSQQPPNFTDTRILILNTQNNLNGVTKWSINNISLSLPTTPYLGAIKFNLRHAYDQTPPPENFPKDYDIFKDPVNPNTTIGNRVYKFHMNEVVDVILQNAKQLNVNGSEIHPWHLHGHDFWVLGYGEGKFDPSIHGNFNLTRAPLRNTVVLFPYGWTALRFKADNPGVWAFHCHIEPHLHMGMGVIFAEAVQKVGKIPRKALTCGLTGNMRHY